MSLLVCVTPQTNLGRRGALQYALLARFCKLCFCYPLSLDLFQGGLGRFCLSSLSLCFYLPFGVFKFRGVKLSEGVVEVKEGDHSCAPLRAAEPQHNQRNTLRKWKQRTRSRRKWRWGWKSRSRWDTCVFVSFASATHCSLLLFFKQDDQHPAQHQEPELPLGLFSGRGNLVP